MRTMVKVHMGLEQANARFKEGALDKIMGTMLETWKPEAAYFGLESGGRTAYLVIDFKDASQMPQFAEPMFTQLGATIEMCPVMNAADLRAGLERVKKG